MGKRLGEYIEVAKLPALIIVAWQVVGSTIDIFLFGGNPMPGTKSFLTALWIVVFIVGLALPLIIGYSVGRKTVSQMKGDYRHAIIVTFIVSLSYAIVFTALSFLPYRAQPQVVESVGMAQVITVNVIDAIRTHVFIWIEMSIAAAIGVGRAQKK